MPFYKQAEVRDAKKIYGFEHKGVFAKELIKRGEAIFTCDLAICDYLPLEEQESQGKTRDQTLELLRKYPESREFIMKYQYMIDDDLYDWPRDFIGQKLNELCMFFNHSCDPNCGFQSLDSSLVVAIRDIQAGEELTYDYQCMDTEASFYDGLSCKCGSFKCRGVLRFDQYRNVDWQMQYYKYSGVYVKKRIDELKTKWFSARCYVKRFNSNNDNKVVELGLTALRKIRKDDLVAIYSDKSQITPTAHYIRQSSKSQEPTCYLVDNEVFAASDIEPETELTLNFD